MTFLYRERAEMNEKTLAVKHYLGKWFPNWNLPGFKVIVATTPSLKEVDPSQEEDEFFGFTNKIKKDTEMVLKW